jgi:hypothetical protein
MMVMIGLKLASASRSSVLGLLLGLLAFVVIFGVRRVDPGYIDWQLEGDSAQHYLGWLFFRYEPWQFPFGRIRGFGTPDGSSIVFTDSIPLLALAFKTLHPWLPERFQYVGLWMVSCYALQGWFGWLLASLVCHDRFAKILITCFFLLSPVLAFRSSGHHALMAHWLILAAIYLSIQARDQFETRHPRLSWTKCWSGLVILSGTIHLYWTAMLVPLYLAAWVADWPRRPSNERAPSIGAPVFTLASLALVLYVEGSFVVSPNHWVDHGAGAFGRYSMNLLAPWSPGYWSNADEAKYLSLFVDPHRSYTDGQYEGLGYLGLGFLVLLAATAGIFAWWLVRYARGNEQFWTPRPPTRVPLPVLLVLVLFALFALSHRATLGSRVLYSIPFGPEMLDRFAVFRASGRFFWPCYYMLLFGGFRAFIWVTRRRPQLFVVGLHAAFTLQALDLSQFLQRLAMQHRRVEEYRSDLADPSWRMLIPQYEDIVYYPPSDTKLYVPLGLLGAPHRVGVNVSYKARSDPDVVTRSETDILRALQTGELERGTLYVFEKADLFENLGKRPNREDYLLQRLGNFYAAARKTGTAHREPQHCVRVDQSCS